MGKPTTVGGCLLRIQRLEKRLVELEESDKQHWKLTSDLKDKANALLDDLLRMRGFLDEWTAQHVKTGHPQSPVQNESRIMHRIELVEAALSRRDRTKEEQMKDLIKSFAAAVLHAAFNSENQDD